MLEDVYAVKSILNLRHIIIAVEDNKPDVIRILTEIADNRDRDPDDEVRVLPLRADIRRARRRC